MFEEFVYLSIICVRIVMCRGWRICVRGFRSGSLGFGVLGGWVRVECRLGSGGLAGFRISVLGRILLFCLICAHLIYRIALFSINSQSANPITKLASS